MEDGCDIILRSDPDLHKAHAGGLGHASLSGADYIIILDSLRRQAAHSTRNEVGWCPARS
jgi:hypothetical protein